MTKVTAKKRFTVVIHGLGGYSNYKVIAENWRGAEEKGKEAYKLQYPNEEAHLIGPAVVIAGWPTYLVIPAGYNEVGDESNIN